MERTSGHIANRITIDRTVAWPMRSNRGQLPDARRFGSLCFFISAVACSALGATDASRVTLTARAEDVEATAPIGARSMIAGAEEPSFSVVGTARPLEFDVFDERTKRRERGFAYPALMSGKLRFADAAAAERWFDPTTVIQIKRGVPIATIVDADMDAALMAERGRLAPKWAEYQSLVELNRESPDAVSRIAVALKEGEALLLEASIREREMKRAVMQTVVAPADAEVMEAARQSGNINPLSGDLFRYYPLSHVRVLLRIPLRHWGPDWGMELRINGQHAQILSIHSVDFDELHEEWILGVEFRPAKSLASMGESFDYALDLFAPALQRRSKGIAFHPPSCALAGRRLSYPLAAPKVSGVLYFSCPENSWVTKGSTVGGVRLDGLDALLEKVDDYRARMDAVIHQVESSLIESGFVAENDYQLVLLRQYRAEASKFIERISGMTMEAKETGLLRSTLDYQGPVTARNADLPARIISPYVEVSDVLMAKEVDVRDQDIVFVQLPSGSERLAKVVSVVSETVGLIEDLSESQRISILLYSPDFQVGEAPDRQLAANESVLESGMPVYVLAPRYSSEEVRSQIQQRLQAEWEVATRQPPLDVPRYPIRFTFRNCRLTPIEKMAYMQQANAGNSETASSYLQRLTEAIIREGDPEARWIAFQRLLSMKFNAGFQPLVELAIRGPPDVATASMFHLREKHREFELFEVLCRFQQQREARPGATKPAGERLFSLCYPLLRGMVDYPTEQADSLTHFIQQARVDPEFRLRLEDVLLCGIIRSEGPNAPASIRILRGEEQEGHPFLPDSALRRIAGRCDAAGDLHLSGIIRRELARRELIDISRNSKFGYGAAFIERGFLYLRDLEKIDALVRSKENYLQDLRFLECSPDWTLRFPLDPEILTRRQPASGAAPPILPSESSSLAASPFPAFGQDIEYSAFRQLANQERSRLLQRLGSSGDHRALVLLLCDPLIRDRYAGDILDWLLVTPQARFELARYYARCTDLSLLQQIDDRGFAGEILADIDSVIRALEALPGPPDTEDVLADPPATAPTGPAEIHVYRGLLAQLWRRNSDRADRFRYLVAWAGLSPSAFELGDELTGRFDQLQQTGVDQQDLQAAIRYVRERRALKHAIARQRAKRAENRKVEIHPGREETLLRETAQEVEAGMPPLQRPLEMLEQRINDAAAAEEEAPREVDFVLQDTLRLVRLRDREFATGKRERLHFEDIATYAGRIVLAPLWLLLLAPLAWMVRAARLTLESLQVRPHYSSAYFQNQLRWAATLSKSIDDGSPVKREILRWMQFLEEDPLNVDRLVRFQAKVKRLMSFRDFVYHVSDDDPADGQPSKSSAQPHRLDPLHPDDTTRLAPRLTLLALLCRLTAERIWQEAGQRRGGGRRLYFMIEWFLQRSAYFSGYRYTLNPLANHQIAENYIWNDIPLVALTDQPAAFRVVLIPLNILVTAGNVFGRIFLSLPMRFLYLFTPISLLGAVVFRRSLRRLVLDIGNALEANLYPDPDAILQRTRQRLRTGWARRNSLPDQPGGRFVFSFRRIATRVLPFVILTTIVSGGFPYIYELLSGQNWGHAWNIRSTGIYAAFAAVFMLTMTMALHWMPLLMGWIPFAHWRNLNRARLLRRRAGRILLPAAERGRRSRLDADEQLQKLNFDNAMAALRWERESAAPVMDVLVLMVEDPRWLERYAALAKSLVSRRTVVLAYATSEFMDGGGARLATLRTITANYAEIRQRYPQLPTRFEETRSFFMPIGEDCDPLLALPVAWEENRDGEAESPACLSPFILAVANAQALMRHSFLYHDADGAHRFVGSITAPPQRLYVGPHNVDQGGRFRGGITLLGAFESIDRACQHDSLAIVGSRAFIRNSSEQLCDAIREHPSLNQWLDPLNGRKRQLSVAQIVIERFRTAARYRRHVDICVRYINEILAIRDELLARGPLGDGDVSDEQFLNEIAIHYMRHLVVPWFIAFQGGSLETYRSNVLTGDLGIRDRRRVFHQRVLELIELFQEESRTVRRQLPKVRIVNAPSARIYYAKTTDDADALWAHPTILLPAVLSKPSSRPGELRDSVGQTLPSRRSRGAMLDMQS